MTTISTATMLDLVPMAKAADLGRSIEFYGQLGFEVVNTFEPEGQLKWAHLRSGSADLMLSLATEPVNAAVQGVSFYMYVPGVAAFREQLAARGLKVGELQYFFFAKDGEFRIEDPDGYVLLVGQAGA